MAKEVLLEESWLRKYDHLIGGFAGGVVSTAVCHPMDLLKIRYSADEGSSIRPRYHSYFHATKCIVRAEGLRGLYQGLTPNMVGAAMSWGLYMEWYHKIKAVLPFRSPNENFDNFLIGFAAGAAVMCFTNPIWVTKTRLCLQYESGAPKKYSGMVDCLRKIYTEEGVRGLYRGFVPGLFGTVHGALQFMIYNRMKAWRCERNGWVRDAQLGQTDYLAFSAISKVIATTATFPYQVLRTRMQDHNVEARGLWRTIMDTLTKEGVTGLYKGCLMANLRQLPAAVVTFATYENVRRYIKNSNF
uniref:Mitochondrial folate transporter/carrier n=1 Tax=Haemonchus contortus TaxID=6289 RepID=A0A7I4YR34_HAECO